MMPRKLRRSGYSLVLSGIVGLLFFWATDARFGLARMLNRDDNIIDLANQSMVGTVVGLAGSAALLLLGLWLLTRRPA
jgi:hypothetical protein